MMKGLAAFLGNVIIVWLLIMAFAYALDDITLDNCNHSVRIYSQALRAMGACQ